MRLGFLASAYINQVGEPPVNVLPRNLAVPLCGRLPAALAAADPQLRRLCPVQLEAVRPLGPIALGNIDTIQNFVHLYDEHWFILVHVEIEQIAAHILAGIDLAARGLASADGAAVNQRAAKVGKQRETTDCRPAPHPRKDGPGPVLQNVPTVHPLLRTRRLRGGRLQRRWISAARPAPRAASCRRSWR